MGTSRFNTLIIISVFVFGCSDTPFNDVQSDVPVTEEKSLSPSARMTRIQLIRNAARDAGLRNAAMLAGIASAETGLAHCWHEATWSCKGPWSEDCNGPVVAGAGDGPCAWQEGGLGLFQFDGGTFTDTLNRDGRSVLTIRGNVKTAVDFVAQMLMVSPYISLSSRSQALEWLSSVKPGTSDFQTWIKTVTHQYNGCEPNYCSIYWQRYDHYAHHARLVYEDMGQDFWNADSTPGGSSRHAVPSQPVDAIEVWWARLNDGSYAFKSIAPQRVSSLKYSIDGYVIADEVTKDDPATAETENNYPTRYRFQSEVSRRVLVVEGFDARGTLVARGRGLLDVVSGVGVYIRQVGAATYQMGLERAPQDIVSISVDVDGYQLRDAVSGQSRSGRLAVRSGFNRLGTRNFRITGYDGSGRDVFSEQRRFALTD